MISVNCLISVHIFLFLLFGRNDDYYDNDYYHKYYQQPDKDTKSKRLRAEMADRTIASDTALS